MKRSLHQISGQFDYSTCIVNFNYLYSYRDGMFIEMKNKYLLSVFLFWKRECYQIISHQLLKHFEKEIILLIGSTDLIHDTEPLLLLMPPHVTFRVTSCAAYHSTLNLTCSRVGGGGEGGPYWGGNFDISVVVFGTTAITWKGIFIHIHNTFTPSLRKHSFVLFR